MRLSSRAAACIVVGSSDLKGLFQPKQLCDSMVGRREAVSGHLLSVLRVAEGLELDDL